MTEKRLKIDKIHDLAKTAFGRSKDRRSNLDLGTLIEKTFGLKFPPFDRGLNQTLCTSSQCKRMIDRTPNRGPKLWMYLHLLFLTTNGNAQGFGSTLAKFAPMIKKREEDNWLSFISTPHQESDMDCNKGPNKSKASFLPNEI